MARTRTLLVWLIPLLLGVVAVAGCSEEEKECPAGYEGCECFPNGSCMDGLSCGVDWRCHGIPSQEATEPGEGTEPGEATEQPFVCEYDEDCDTHEGDEGKMCSDGTCIECASDDECQQSPHYGPFATCQDGRCVPGQPCTVVGCPDGQVCDEMNGKCREPKTCEDLQCSPRLCRESEPGKDAECLEECEEGYVWNKVSEKCEVIPPNCREDWDNSILAQCRSEHRLCVETLEGAHCGDCQPGYVEDNGTCRQTVKCTDLQCDQQNRSCVEATDHSDAYCYTCLPGYVEQEGECVAFNGGSCDPGDPDSILDQCQLSHRECVEDAAGAHCGDCLEGFVENPNTGTCEPRHTCEELGCAALHRVCVQQWNEWCGECETGYVEDPDTGKCVCAPGTLPDEVTGECVPIRTCADIGDACASAGMLCIESDGKHHAYCRRCAEDEAWYEHQQRCIPCPPCFGAGETGRVYEITTRMGHCVCETKPGYFHSEVGMGGTLPCDEDGDGWVVEEALIPLSAPEGTAERENARCELRYIDRFVLINEEGDSTEIYLDRYDFLSFTGPVPLIEPANRDRDADLKHDMSFTDPQLKNYAPTVGGVPLKASDLNPLTKMCATTDSQYGRYADYNANGVPDVDDPGVSSTASDPFRRIFDYFSYYIELADGWYEKDPGADYGRYVIREKSRSLAAMPDRKVPLDYGTSSSYWRSCHRLPDTTYDPAGPQYTMDFAWAGPNDRCSWSHEVPGRWCGMLHHSQFKCMLAVDDSELSEDYPHHQTVVEMRKHYTLNECSATGRWYSYSNASVANPTHPDLSCETTWPSKGSPVWALAKFEPYSGDYADAQYVRGCVDECAEAARLPENKQCPENSECKVQVKEFGLSFCIEPIEFVDVPVSTEPQTMGSPEDEFGRDDDETQHQVGFTVDRALRTMKYEATRGTFVQLLNYDPSAYTCTEGVCVLDSVNFFEAVAYANLLSYRLNLPPCYFVPKVVCEDGTVEWNSYHYPWIWNYCKGHGRIVYMPIIRPMDAAGAWIPNVAYCDGLRLPTEAEWEYLARGGSDAPWYNGSGPTDNGCGLDPALDAIAWYCGNASKPMKPGLKAPNAYGLYDMLGNVWEWVWDVYGDYPTGTVFDYEARTHVPPPGSDLGEDAHGDEPHVIRGGGWSSSMADLRAANRQALPSDTSYHGVGFRLVRTISDFNPSRYTLYQVSLNNILDYVAFCHSHGQEPVKADTLYELFKIKELASTEVGDSNEFVLIGLLRQEGQYVWYDGTPLTYDLDGYWMYGRTPPDHDTWIVYMYTMYRDENMGADKEFLHYIPTDVGYEGYVMCEDPQ